MAKAREFKRRLRALGKTKQITKTMELVATSKMKKTQERVIAARPYTQKLAEILASVDLDAVRVAAPGRYPLLAARETVRRVAVVALTSNRGLAGGLNANVVRATKNLVIELQGVGRGVDLHVFGKKGIAALKYARFAMKSTSIELTDKPDYRIAERLGDEMIAAFTAGDIDELRLVYPRFRSLVSQPATVDLILPLSAMIERMKAAAAAAGAGGDAGFASEPRLSTSAEMVAVAGAGTGHGARGTHAAARTEFILEPSPELILDALLPLFVKNGLYRAMLELAASEQAARRVAMKNATDNAEDLMTILSRQYNRARQAQITQELAEIVGGANALE
jgi:F-type H+-transporting ATPase subunit gamma